MAHCWRSWPLLEKIHHELRVYIAWTGIVGLIASLFVIIDAALFPAPAALLPVLATMAVIAVGTGSPTHGSLFLLTKCVSGYMGYASYSLYMAHFTVIVFLAQFMDEGATYYALALLLMLAVSLFAYNLVEDPIREPGWVKRFQTAARMPERISHRYKVTAI